MTQPSKILWFTFCVGAFLLLAVSASAQTYVTPTVKPTPPGRLITVNNTTGGDHSDPHVSGDLVAYSNSDGTGFTIRYFNLATGVDAGVPNNGTFQNFLADVRGSVIGFTRLSISGSSIFTFDTANPSTPPVETNPPSTGARDSAQIGDETIAWRDSSAGTGAEIVAFNRLTGTTTELTNDSLLNESPGISPDGTVIVWVKCATISSPCSTWKATLSNGIWSAQQSVSQVGNQSHPDTDGTIIAYSANWGAGDQLLWQPVAGGTEQVLNLSGGNASTPSVSGGPQNSLVAFSYLPAGGSVHDLALYNPATNVLYDITKDEMPGNTADKQLSDISVTPDGKVRVVWMATGTSLGVYAYTFNLPVGDFGLSAITPMTIAAGGSGSTNVTVNPVNGFSSAVDLTVTGQPNGVLATPSPTSVTPSGGNPATSVLNVNVPLFLVPTNFTLTVTGTSGTLTHSATADITVTSTTSSIGNLVGDLLNAGCIDNGGVASALTSKLAAAQAAISAGNIQTAINTLTALKNQINAQAGKHIATSCAIGGVAFNPVTVLLADVQGLIDSLRVSMTPDPITGYVVDSTNGVGVPGVTVSILDGGGMTVATAVTDITGFYFFATTNVLIQSPSSSYTVAVTGLPPGFVTIPAASPAFPWTGAGMMIGNFVLN
jgi:hypothetical protein